MNVVDHSCMLWTAKGLEQITVEKTAEVMQVSSDNPMVGLEGRASLLVNLSHALKSNPTFFGAEGRPGNMIGTLIHRPTPGTSISSALSHHGSLAQISSNQSLLQTDRVVVFPLPRSGTSSSRASHQSGPRTARPLAASP
jgi:hypothetical protein